VDSDLVDVLVGMVADTSVELEELDDWLDWLVLVDEGFEEVDDWLELVVDELVDEGLDDVDD